MKAILNGHVLAESDNIVETGGYAYFPPSATRLEWLKKAPKTESDHACPHGVQFYDVIEGATKSPRAAWSYEAPQAKMKPVDHWMGFWEDVTVA